MSSISLCGEGGVWAVVTVPSSSVLGRAVHMYAWSLGRGCRYISNTSAIWEEEEKCFWEAVSGRAPSPSVSDGVHSLHPYSVGGKSLCPHKN